MPVPFSCRRLAIEAEEKHAPRAKDKRKIDGAAPTVTAEADLLMVQARMRAAHNIDIAGILKFCETVAMREHFAACLSVGLEIIFESVEEFLVREKQTPTTLDSEFVGGISSNCVFPVQ